MENVFTALLRTHVAQNLTKTIKEFYFEDDILTLKCKAQRPVAESSLLRSMLIVKLPRFHNHIMC